MSEGAVCTKEGVLALTVSIKDLLEAGVHFGHQTKRWNPKMKKYIFEARNGIYIIDLKKTMDELTKAYEFLKSVASMGEPVLFVGTKKQAKESVHAAAMKCGMYYITERWLGGLLTNNRTIRRSIERLKTFERMEKDGSMALLPKKEASTIRHEMTRLHKNLDGIKNMDAMPKAVVVIDPGKEKIAVSEAKKLGIPIAAVIDTNSNPDDIDYCVPGNDDAMRAVRLLTSVFADAVLEGKAHVRVAREKAEKEAAEKAAEKAARKESIADVIEESIAKEAKRKGKKILPAGKEETPRKHK